jgi:hypothetical protein
MYGYIAQTYYRPYNRLIAKTNCLQHKSHHNGRRYDIHACSSYKQNINVPDCHEVYHQIYLIYLINPGFIYIPTQSHDIYVNTLIA